MKKNPEVNQVLRSLANSDEFRRLVRDHCPEGMHPVDKEIVVDAVIARMRS
jgi:hypothetical protein